MLELFKTRSIVDENSAQNIFQIFSWAIENFDKNAFANKTELVLPNSRFFPDRANNEWDMAEAIKNRTLDYCGLAHWPFELVPPVEFNNTRPTYKSLTCDTRHTYPENQERCEDSPLLLTYSPAMLKKPMDFVASMSTLIAQHYLLQSGKEPPTGKHSFQETAEILSIFMGFGILMANSAYTFRGSCAKCYDPRANRSAAVPENEAVFALALFCTLKNIPNKSVSPFLKPHLKKSLKKASKEISLLKNNQSICELLEALPSESTSK